MHVGWVGLLDRCRILTNPVVATGLPLHVSLTHTHTHTSFLTIFLTLQIRPDAVHNNYASPLPHTYLSEASSLPDNLSWANVNGVSYLTHSLNQHIPQYCGSCWAHGALSALADRIKIARLGQGDDINLSIQYILNCGGGLAGSCHGGYHTSTYEFIQQVGYVPYDTCMSYLACSEESTEGFCPQLDTSCTPDNTCRTCDTFAGMGGACSRIDYFPNATVAEYGLIDLDDFVVHKIQTELYVRGPVAATINAEPIVEYAGGVFGEDGHSQRTNHIVSITGWGTDEDTGKLYWIVRNSWGQYWGEMGFMRIEAGKNLLGIEGEVAWATPGSFTTQNFPCSEDGKNCKIEEPVGAVITQQYVDPSTDVATIQRRLQKDVAQSRLRA
jgi:cathepsin X